MPAVAAKVWCDKRPALPSKSAHRRAALTQSVRINHALADTALKLLLPGLRRAIKVGRRRMRLLRLLVKETYRDRAGIAKPRKPSPKPHQ